MGVLGQSGSGYDVLAGQVGVAMRPNKNINPGAHRSGNAGGGKNRHISLPEPEPEDEPIRQLYVPDSVRMPNAESELSSTKYAGRQTVGPSRHEDADVTIDLTHEDWLNALNANMLSALDLIRATVYGMMGRGFGRVVNVPRMHTAGLHRPFPVRRARRSWSLPSGRSA